MIALVIPSIRTPRGITGFDYDIPDNTTIRVGDLVRVPFRNKTIVGLVIAINRKTEIKAPLKRIIGTFYDLHLPTVAIPLMTQLAERSFTSPSTILHSWLGTLPKREMKQSSEPHSRNNAFKKDNPATHSSAPLFLSDHLNHPEGIFKIAQQSIKQGKRVLILSPWSARAEQIAEALHTTAMTSELASGKRFRLWHDFIHGDSRILVATRIGAWCGIGADAIIVDEPENDDHKQDELSPRYDARWICAYLHSKGTELISIGTTPRLAHLVNNDVKQQNQIPTIHADVAYVDIHRSDWSNIPSLQCRTQLLLDEAVRDQRPIFIINPVHGEQTRLKCKDCAWSAICPACGAGMLVEKGMLFCRRCHHRSPALVACPACRGTQFAFSKPGRIRLTEELKKNGLDHISVVSVGEWNALKTTPNNSLVILTDLSLLAGAREDLRATEQTVIAWRRLADLCASRLSKLVVQGDPSTLSRAKEWLTAEGCFHALQKEISERKTFLLPPVGKLVKLIFRGNMGHATRTLDLLRNSVKEHPLMTIAGPYEVKFRPTHRETRWIGHLSAPLETPIQEIMRVLYPIAKQTDTLIDLDPIAFFE